MSTATLVKPSDVLLDVANVLETEGWCRGVFHDTKGRHCSLGAVEVVVKRRLDGTKGHARNAVHRVDREARDAFEDDLRDRYGRYTYIADTYIAEWNDSQRDKRKVIRAIRRTAKRLANIGR